MATRGVAFAGVEDGRGSAFVFVGSPFVEGGALAEPGSLVELGAWAAGLPFALSFRTGWIDGAEEDELADEEDEELDELEEEEEEDENEELEEEEDEDEDPDDEDELEEELDDDALDVLRRLVLGTDNPRRLSSWSLSDTSRSMSSPLSRAFSNASLRNDAF